MNRRQVAVIAIGVAALLGMGVYCPWYVKEPEMPGAWETPDGYFVGGLTSYRTATKYRWYFDPPEVHLRPATVRVDWVRLLLQAAGMMAVGAFLMRFAGDSARFGIQGLSPS